MSDVLPVGIVSCVRTPVGKIRGKLATTRPDTLLAAVIQEALARAPGLPPEAVEEVIVGCAMPEAEQGMNVARMGTLLARLPTKVPAFTVNRFCASGLEAIHLAASKIRLKEADVVIAAGVESMSMVPMGGHVYTPNYAVFSDPAFTGMAHGMGLTAERVAKEYKISREQQDIFSQMSHARALAAIAKGAFKAEILAIAGCEQDEGPRESDVGSLAKLRTVFAAQGSVTAGNSSQMSDGAAALILLSEKACKQYNLKPMAHFGAYSVAGVDPEVMGIGPVVAIPKALAQQNIKSSDLDWIELNEAFAAQILAVIQELDLDPAKVNPCGGAIALGHPLGATGAIRATTLIHALQRHKLQYGMVSMCIGTGMGAAGVFKAAY